MLKGWRWDVAVGMIRFDVVGWGRNWKRQLEMEMTGVAFMEDLGWKKVGMRYPVLVRDIAGFDVTFLGRVLYK